MRTKKITLEQEKKIINLKNQMTAKEIAENIGVTIYQVYEVYRRNNLTNKYNQEVKITEFQEQIILSGIIGDGRLKRNGRYNYYYSECHALDEYEYCEWKMKNLGELTKSTALYPKNINNKSSNAVEFTTKTTPSLIKYADMKKNEVIEKLNIEGLMLLILDDGWFNKHSKKGNFCISGGELTQSELENLIIKYENIGIKGKIIGIKRKDISLSSDSNILIYNYLKEFMDMDIDIINKKFLYMYETNQVSYTS